MTFIAQKLLDSGIAEDCVFVLADVHTAARLCEDVQPSVSGQLFGHKDTLFAIRIEHL